MGTSGMIGFYRDGVTKATYCHFDSGPDGVGADVLATVQAASYDELLRAFDNIQLVDENEPAPPALQERYRKFSNTAVSTGSLSEWYCLLRGAQGDLKAWIHDGCQHMVDSSDFILNSTFCEYAYLVNLNGLGTFEAYRGFQSEPHNKGRYAKNEPADPGNYPCCLVASWPLDKLPTSDELIQTFTTEEQDD